MRKGERKRQEILDVAEDLFFTKGYEETAVQDILDALNGSKGSFYHHFNTKLDLMRDIASRHAKISRLQYFQSKSKNPPENFQLLLHHAGLFRREETGLLRSLRSLLARQEGPVLLDALKKAAASAFYPEFSEVMNELKKLDLASFSGEYALRVSFSSFLGGCSMILEETAALPKDEAAAGGILLLRAVRAQMEAALGLRAGSAVIAETNELAEILSSLSDR